MQERVTRIDPENPREREFNVYFADGMISSAVDLLRDHPGIVVDGKEATTPEQMLELLRRKGKDAVDAVVVRSASKFKEGTRFGENTWAQLLNDPSIHHPALFGRAGIGVDNFNEKLLAAHGIILENAPQGNVDAVVAKTLADIEHVDSMQFRGTAALRERDSGKVKWSETPDPFKGKVFGVVGLGNIGTSVAKAIIARGGTAIGYDPYKKVDGVENVSLDDLCSKADVITIHAALTDSSMDMIGEQQLNLMKDTAVLINNARGGIVNERALLEHLRAGKLHAAVLDVFTKEKKALVNEDDPYVRDVLRPLLEHPRVVSTMHSAANSQQAQTRNGIDIANQVKLFAAGRGIANGVNFPSVSLNGISLPGTSYRFLVLNNNVPGVHNAVANAIRSVHDGYNVDAGTTQPSFDGQRAALIQEVTFRRESDQAIEVVSYDMAKRMIETVRAVEHVLGVHMFRVDRKAA